MMFKGTGYNIRGIHGHGILGSTAPWITDLLGDGGSGDHNQVRMAVGEAALGLSVSPGTYHVLSILS